jgi:hypothetical protein
MFVPIEMSAKELLSDPVIFNVFVIRHGTSLGKAVVKYASGRIYHSTGDQGQGRDGRGRRLRGRGSSDLRQPLRRFMLSIFYASFDEYSPQNPSQ